MWWWKETIEMWWWWWWWWRENNRNVVVVVYSFTNHEAVLRKNWSLGSTQGRYEVDFLWMEKYIENMRWWRRRENNEVVEEGIKKIEEGKQSNCGGGGK